MLAHAAPPDGETLRFRRAEIFALEHDGGGHQGPARL